MLSKDLCCIVTSSRQESQLFKNRMEMNGEEFRFLANFVSEDIMLEFFGYQSSKTAFDSLSYSGGVADMANGGQTSNIGEQDEIRLISTTTNSNTAKSTKNWISKYAAWANDNWS